MSEATPIRVLVLAAYPAVRAGLQALLDGEAGISVVGATTPAALGDGWAAAGPLDVLVIDRDDDQFTDDDLPAALAALPQVILLSGHEGPPPERLDTTAPRAWLARDASAEELASAVQAVRHGLIVLDPAWAAALLRPVETARTPVGQAVAEPLSEREREVLDLLALGLPNKTIALRLGISEHTVKFHVGAILGKLGAAGRTEAVMTAARLGLLAL